MILRDARGILLEAVPLIKPWKGYEVDENELRYLGQELSAAQEQLAAERARATEEVVAELNELKNSLEAEKQRAKDLWDLQCQQAAEQETALNRAEEEAQGLRTQLACLRRRLEPLETSIEECTGPGSGLPDTSPEVSKFHETSDGRTSDRDSVRETTRTEISLRGSLPTTSLAPVPTTGTSVSQATTRHKGKAPPSRFFYWNGP